MSSTGLSDLLGARLLPISAPIYDSFGSLFLKFIGNSRAKQLHKSQISKYSVWEFWAIYVDLSDYTVAQLFALVPPSIPGEIRLLNPLGAFYVGRFVEEHEKPAW